MLDIAHSSPPATPAHGGAIPLRDFLAQVGAVLTAGLPSEVWIEATVLAVKASTYGHSLELVDAAPGHGPAAQLSVFLPRATLATIRQQLGIPLEPTHLVGMTVVVLIAPRWDPRWHVGARLLRVAGSVTASLRQKMIDAVVESLRKDRILDAQARLRPPVDITRLAVIHPPHAQGWGDIEAELLRWEAAGIVVMRSVPCRLEGDGAAGELAAALRAAGAPIAGSPPDVVLLVRGGGGRSGLLMLDTEPVARAICGSLVPIVTGVGHAGDTTLADRVAWRRADTPSKALTVVAEIIGGVARRVETDRGEIARLADQIAIRAEQQLDLLRGQVARGAQAGSAIAASELEARWAAVQVGATAIRGGLDRQAERLARLLADQGQCARGVIEAAGQALRRLRTEIADRAWRALSRADAGEAMLAGVGAHVRAALDHAKRELERAYAMVHERIGLQIDLAEAALGQIAPVLDAHDIAGTLRRGFVLVRDRDGTVVADRRHAATETLLRLTFHDGELAVQPQRDP